MSPPLRFSSLAVLLSASAACDSDASSSEAPVCTNAALIVAAGNNSSSSSLCTAPGSCVAGADLGSQPVLASSNGRMFFVARDNDLLIEVDTACATPLSKVSLDSLAPKDALGKTTTANPHDVAAAKDGTLVVPLYNVPKLAFVKNGQIETIDLAEYDEADGNPQAESVSIVRVGGSEKAFVALERLDDKAGLRPSLLPSQMLRVDIATRKVEATIPLEGQNPFNPMAELDGALFLSEPGSFDSASDPKAGIERFDTSTSTSRLLVREDQLGASVIQIAVTKGCGAAIVADPQPNVNRTSVVTFDPESGQILATIDHPVLGPTPNYDLYGLTWRDHRLYVGDRRRAAAGYPIQVFERGDGCTLTDTNAPLFVDQAPIALRPAVSSSTP